MLKVKQLWMNNSADQPFADRTLTVNELGDISVYTVFIVIVIPYVDQIDRKVSQICFSGSNFVICPGASNLYRRVTINKTDNTIQLGNCYGMDGSSALRNSDVIPYFIFGIR